jgi:WD40 repeat protein
VAALEFDADSEVVVWDAATGKATFTLPFERSTIIWDMAISPDGSKLAISSFPGGEYRFEVWDIEAKKEITTIKTTDRINEVTWINQNQAAVTSHGWINIYDLISGTKLRTVAEGGYHVAISPDISLVAAPKDWGTLDLYDFNSGDVLAHLSLEPVSIISLAISPDGKMLAALTEYGSMIIWDISSYYNK